MRIEDWPPIIQGPFGNGTSPLLAYGGLRDHAGGRSPSGAETARPDADALIEPLEDVVEWKGLDVFGWDGRLGALRDMGFEPATRTITHLTVDAPGANAVLGFSRLRYRSNQGGILNVDARRADLAAKGPMERV
ncbi:MAG: hypothetical protein QNJ13_00985 [Paracoccaceae bacterium]|nr:hypothetical protein [Paracoccaceae bacterium]